MATEVDSLFVTLKLNAENLRKGLEEVDRGLKQIGKATEKTSREFSDMGRQFDNALRKMRNEFLGFLTVFTAGKSIKNFVEDTIESSAELDRLSKNLGIAATRLRAYQDANEIAGGTSGGIIGQLKANADAIARFKSGLDMGEDIREALRQGVTTDAFKDAESYLRAQADVINRMYKQDPNQARVFAQRMGISEDVFNLIKNGASALDGYLKNAAKLSGMTNKDAEAAEKLRQEFEQLQKEFRQTGERIVYALNPAFKEIVGIGRGLAQWVNENKDNIVGFFKEGVQWVKEFAQGLRDGKYDEHIKTIKDVASAFWEVAKAIAAAIRGLVQFFGWWGEGNTLSAQAEGMLDSGSDGLFGLTGNYQKAALDDASLKEKRDYIAAELKKNGFSDAQASGIIGNLLQENSTLDPKLKNKIGATGIAQWLSKDRKANFKNLFGKEVGEGSFEEQVKFLIWELNNSEKRAGNLIRKTRSARDAAVVTRREYERPGEEEANDNKRIAYAEQDYRSRMGKTAYSATGGISPTALAAQTTNNVRNASVTISGPITINTRATDPRAIKQEMLRPFMRNSIATQANSGMF